MADTKLLPVRSKEKIAAASGFQDRSLPIEQACVWEKYEISQGHALWGRLAWYEEDTLVAFITLYDYKVRGVRYLWAKWGPVWLKEATPAREEALRADLVALVKKRDPGVAFIRLHAYYQHPDLHMPLQTIAYDRTVVIDTRGKTKEKIIEAMPTAGRRSIRSGERKAEAEGVTFQEETDRAHEVFDEYYAVMEETAERDGFRPHPKQVYLDMLDALGPEHARIFSLRDREGALLCWDMCLVQGVRAQAEYGASTEKGRKMRQPPVLDLQAAVLLASEGVKFFDLMGAHSARSPELYGVGKYKMVFAQGFTEVPGGWELPIKKNVYRALSAAKALRDRRR